MSFQKMLLVSLLMVFSAGALAQTPAPAPSLANPYKPNYSEKIEADNGATYMVDLNFVSRFSPGTVKALIYDEGRRGTFAMLFDCRGNGAIYGAMLEYLPPRSVAARFSAIACAEADRKIKR